MWDRKELKARGKRAFKGNYWRCVLVALILVLVAGGASLGGTAASGTSDEDTGTSTELVQGVDVSVDGSSSAEELIASFQEQDSSTQKAIVAILVGVSLLVALIAFLLQILIFNPIDVGCRYFFTRNSRERADLGAMGRGFKSGYGRVVKTMFLADLFLFLWTCLFIIPGIVKSYSYRMVPYITAERPDLSGREVINLSRQMMNGNKGKAFVMDLSFILWWLLSAITLGIVGVFYVNPYYQATYAELYHELSGEPQAYVE